MTSVLWLTGFESTLAHAISGRRAGQTAGSMASRVRPVNRYSILGKQADVLSASLPCWMPGQKKSIQPGVYSGSKPALRVHREEAL